MQEVDAAILALTTNEKAGNDTSIKSGLYAIRLISPGLLAPFAEGEGGLIYIGMSSDLVAREFDLLGPAVLAKPREHYQRPQPHRADSDICRQHDRANGAGAAYALR